MIKLTNEWVKNQKQIIDRRRGTYIQYLVDDFTDLLKSYPNALKSFEKTIRDIDEVNALPPSEEKNERIKYLPNRNDCVQTSNRIRRKINNIQTLKDIYTE